MDKVLRLINNRSYVSPSLYKSHITLPEKCLCWVLYVGFIALQIKALAQKKKILCVYRNESLCVDNP
jgi:hypothetical protein